MDYEKEHENPLKDTLGDVFDDLGLTISPKQDEQKFVEWNGKISVKNAEGTLKKMLKERWSEEDEAKLKEVISNLNYIYNKETVELYNGNKDAHPKYIKELIYWLESLKDRVLLQPKQKLSEEDELQLSAAIEICNSSGHTYISNWLKQYYHKMK